MIQRFSGLLAAQVFLVITASSAQDLILSPGTRQKIPTRLIRRFTRTKFSAHVLNSNYKDLVFEVVSNDRLFGPALNISLGDIARPVNTDFSITYESNGKQKDGPPTDVYMTQGGGFTVVYERANRNVLALWGNGIYLKPVHKTKFRGVFVNIHNTLQLYDGAMRNPLEMSRYESIRQWDTLPGQYGNCASGAVHRVELAIAYDNTFCALHSNSEVIASAYVQAAVNEASFVFMRDTCVSLSLVHIESHCEDPQDPYNSLATPNLSSGIAPSSQILEGFKAIWGNSRRQVYRDVAYFFSGFQDGTNVAGLAYVAATCGSSGYGWVEKGDVSIFVHEVGHSLAATHSTAGVMKATPDQLDAMFFSDSSVAQITEFIDNHGYSGAPSYSRDSRCIEMSRAKCDNTCPGKCVDGQCIATYYESVPSGIVPCSPVRLIFRCTRTIFYRFTLGDDCPTGFDFVLREGQDLDVFCCNPPLDTISMDMVTAEYPFVNLRLTNPNRSQQTYPEYIQDTSVISTRTLMRSQLNPSCGIESRNISPLPTTSKLPLATVSPIPLPSVSAKPVASAYPSLLPSVPPTLFPIMSPRPPPQPSAQFESQTPQPGFSPNVSQKLSPKTASPSPSLAISYTTCAGTFATGRTFGCMRRSAFKSRSSIRNASIKLRISQRSGLFYLKVKVGRRIKIHEVAALITMNGDADERNLNPPVSFGANGTSSANFSTDAFSMQIPEGKRSCCGEQLFSYVLMTVCSSRNPSKCTTTELLRGNVKMKCRSPCRRYPTGSILPFSESNDCPKCVY